MYQAMHSGAWLPPSAWADADAWDRLIAWIRDHSSSEAFDLRLVVTPQLDSQLGNPEGLRTLAEGAERQNARGDGSRQWSAGDGPIIIVWPEEKTVSKWAQAVTGLNEQSIVMVEQPVPKLPTFQGWATAVGAYNAGAGKDQQPIAGLDQRLDEILTWYENELASPPRVRPYGASHDVLRGKLQDLAADGYDEDFIVTYAIGLGYVGSLPLLRRHYAAAQAA